MKLRKADEMEKDHNLKSARNAFIFYTAALFIWGLIHLIQTGNTGVPITILLVGSAIFWFSRSFLYRKTQ
ncbi:hypothetical protein [Guptibacillus hwajinpoensis]|uniref:hypothetical protein n=1 Tax=Guptibacillus hwajinpoensis TaxID=208199 RepID=UPI00384DE126